MPFNEEREKRLIATRELAKATPQAVDDGPEPLRVLVCGGRDYDNVMHVVHALDRLHARRPIGLIIHGAARGADSLAKHWAILRSVPDLPFPADWDGPLKHRAGPRRNAQMLREGKPDLVVAFPGGRGTRDMVRRAEETGVKVWFPKSTA